MHPREGHAYLVYRPLYCGFAASSNRGATADGFSHALIVTHRPCGSSNAAKSSRLLAWRALELPWLTSRSCREVHRGKLWVFEYAYGWEKWRQRLRRDGTKYCSASFG
jgi:hypothetical protein